MDNALSAAEQEVVKPYLIELYEQGIEKDTEKGREEGREEGMERLILAFLKKNPAWSNEQVAAYFEIDAGLIGRIRKTNQK